MLFFTHTIDKDLLANEENIILIILVIVRIKFILIEEILFSILLFDKMILGPDILIMKIKMIDVRSD